MAGFLFLAILVLLASVAVLVGTVVFFVWAAQYFGRRAYRQATRRHLYVPVEAQVTRVLGRGYRGATVYVEYEFGGAKVVNRFMTTNDVALLAQQSKQIALQIDPDHPKDVVVDPAFEARAAEAPKPPGWGMPLGATTFSGYALLLAFVLFGAGGVAVGLGWLRKGTVHSGFLVALTIILPSLYVVCLLLWPLRFKAGGGNRLDPSKEEKEKGPRSSA
jgi:hypothetical protein